MVWALTSNRIHHNLGIIVLQYMAEATISEVFIQSHQQVVVGMTFNTIRHYYTNWGNFLHF